MALSPLWYHPLSPPDTRVVSVENDGAWEAGGTYEVVVREYFVIKVDFNASPATIEYTWQYNLVPFEDYWGGFVYEKDFFEVDEGGLFKNEAEAKKYVSNRPQFFANETNTPNKYWSDPTPLLQESAWNKDSRVEVYNNDTPGSFNLDSSDLLTYSVTIPSDTPEGNYVLKYVGVYFELRNRALPILRNTMFFEEYIPITVGSPTSSGVSFSFPESRPDEYDEESVWVPSYVDGIPSDWGDITDLTTLGGGRYGKQLIAVSDQGEIYFGALT